MGEGIGPTACLHTQAGTTRAARQYSRARWAASWPSPNAKTAALAAALSSATRVSTVPDPVPLPSHLCRHPRSPAPAPRAGMATCIGPGPWVGGSCLQAAPRGSWAPRPGSSPGSFLHTLAPLFSHRWGLSEAGMGSGRGRGRGGAAQADLPPSPTPGAVCKFCEARGSELYQKEVRDQGRWGGAAGGAQGRPLSPSIPRYPT